MPAVDDVVRLMAERILEIMETWYEDTEIVADCLNVLASWSDSMIMTNCSSL